MEINEKRFNKGNESGRTLIRHSLKELGCGRSILVDKDGVVICGNDVYRIAKELGKKVVVIETDGDILVAVKRTDISAYDKKGMEIALVDNLCEEKNSNWDADELIRCMNDDFSFDPRKWGAHSCLVKELDLDSLLKENVQTIQKKTPTKSCDTNLQLTLFD